MNRAVSLLIILAVAAPLAQPASAQEPLRPGRLPREVRSALKPGLIARFFRAGGEAAQSDARVSRMAALYVPEGAPASPFLDAGPFRAELDGYLRLKLKGDYVFSATGNGGLALEVNGQSVLKGKIADLSRREPAPVSMARGHNHLRIEYRSPAEGDAEFRLHWSPPGTYAESIPPVMLSHDARDSALRQGSLLREGRALLAGRRCLKCHTTGDDPLARAGHMGELDADAPDLSRAGERLTEEWLARWILDPHSLRNHVTMPAMLTGLDEPVAAQQAVDLAAFLGTLNTVDMAADPRDTDPDDADSRIAEGSALIETLGCIACHLLEPPEEEDVYDRTTLYAIGRKFRSGALREFLLQPHAHYAWIRMPDFRLSDDEATALAAYLLDKCRGDVEPIDAPLPGDSSRGRAEFGRLGCANCHVVREKVAVAKLAPRAFANLDAGCLAADAPARGVAPDFALSEEQREALQAFLSRGGDSLARSHPAETAARYMRELRCVACHSRDDGYGYLPEILSEEGSLGLPPEIVPHLTWAGEKLQSPWTAQQIAGKLPYRSRPWLKIRMPAFPARAAPLAHGLAAQHGIGHQAENPPELDKQVVEVGRRLSLKDGGFHCFQCHGVGPAPAEGAFDIRGVNFSYVADRLRHEYYLRWMANPLQYDPATKMPKFSSDGTTTPLKHVYDGDARRQFDALWQYLHSQRTDR